MKATFVGNTVFIEPEEGEQMRLNSKGDQVYFALLGNWPAAERVANAINAAMREPEDHKKIESWYEDFS